MSAVKIPNGSKFGRWTVLGDAPKTKIGRGSMSMSKCSCDCGATGVVRSAQLRSGKSLSCGCLRRENSAERMRNRAKHGMAASPEYRIWRCMKERCNNQNHQAHHRYGGRGITICESWSTSFEAFFVDMGVRPAGMSLDRLDNDSGYSPENCRWATRKEQARNTRTNSLLTYAGRTMTIAEFCEITGFNHRSVSTDKKKGLSGDAIFEARRNKATSRAAA